MSATASPTLRRALRRRRAAARRAWYLHRRGLIQLGSKKLRLIFATLQEHHSKDRQFLRLIATEMAAASSSGWLCGTCRKMRSPNAWFCDICGGSWEVTAIEPAANRGQSSWQQRTKSPRHRTRPKSRKKQQSWQGEPASAQELHPQWAGSGGSWSTAYAQDPKGAGKGYAMTAAAAPPPPPPPLLMNPQIPQGVPWMPAQMPAMQSMPFMAPPMDAAVLPMPQQVPPEVMDPEDYKAALSAQQKLNKIMKAAKKEENLSPEFQTLVQTEKKKDDKESTNNLLAAVRAHGKAKEALVEVESSRMQLWAQWRTFLHQSVSKWKEYTSQFQASEQAFQQRMQDATTALRKAQRRVDLAKKRADATTEEGVHYVTDDEMEESEAFEEAEVPRDENAMKIQEGLNQVVTSLTVLSESADRLEPKTKRPRTKDDEDGSNALPSSQSFAKADTK